MPKNDNTTLLVTCGAGFIGSALIRLLIRETNCRVVNVDKLTYAGNLESLAEAAESDRYAFEQVDICDQKALARVFKTHQPDAVMHLAAESHVDRSIEGPGEFIQTNVVGTYNLLEQARSYWNELEGDAKANFRFHHISTDEVYGDLPHPNDVRREAQGESVAPNTSPLTTCPYSPNKLPTPPAPHAPPARPPATTWCAPVMLPSAYIRRCNPFAGVERNERVVPNHSEPRAV